MYQHSPLVFSLALHHCISDRVLGGVSLLGLETVQLVGGLGLPHLVCKIGLFDET